VGNVLLLSKIPTKKSYPLFFSQALIISLLPCMPVKIFFHILYKLLMLFTWIK